MFAEMATTERCSMCDDEVGRMYCTGCKNHFCAEHYEIHRKEMFTEMDKIYEERNRLDVAINNRVQHDDQQSPIFELIEKWKNNFIEKVEEAAAKAREQAIQLLNSKQTKIDAEFTSFSQELVRLRNSRNYVEDDLTRFNQMISQYEKNLREENQPTTIKLNTEQSDAINWDSLIYVEEHPSKQKNENADMTTPL